MSVKDKKLETAICVTLSRLIGPEPTPLAVAFSGGGDSTALLSLVLQWTKERPVHALIVNHNLRQGAYEEANLALKRARAMGAYGHILTCQWGGAKPVTGLQEKARNARYHLLAQACQTIGADRLLLGHNQDDQAETVLMRKNAGSGWRGLAAMAERANYPVWPVLADLTIIRPLLACTRADLRHYNRSKGLAWIEDPSNENRQFARIRARKFLAGHAGARQNLLVMAKASQEVLDLEKKQIAEFIQTYIRIYQWGGVGLPAGFRDENSGMVAEALKYLIPAISGQADTPNLQKRMQLAKKLKRTDFGGATLGGVRFVVRKTDILCVRDPGAVMGRGRIKASPPLNLSADIPAIWDGRFELLAQQDRIIVTPLGQWLDSLPGECRMLLNTLPVEARPTLPVFSRPVFSRNGGIIHIPFIGDTGSAHGFSAVSRVRTRLTSLLGHSL